MENDTVKKVEDIINKIDKSENTKVEKIEDSLSVINKSVVAFLKARIDDISSNDSLLNSIKDEFFTMIADQKLTFEQLLRLFNSIKENNSVSSESLLSLLRPVPNTPNRLLESMSENKTGDKGEEFFQSLNKDEMTKVMKMVNVLSKISSMNDDSNNDGSK
jgi:hypothetical protein